MVDELVVELAGKQVGENLTDSSGELMELTVFDDDGIQTGIAVVAKLFDDVTNELMDIALCRPTSDEAQLFINSDLKKQTIFFISSHLCAYKIIVFCNSSTEIE